MPIDEAAKRKRRRDGLLTQGTPCRHIWHIDPSPKFEPLRSEPKAAQVVSTSARSADTSSLPPEPLRAAVEEPPRAGAGAEQVLQPAAVAAEPLHAVPEEAEQPYAVAVVAVLPPALEVEM